MHVPAPHPALFTETEETDLTWVGLCCSPSLPSRPQDTRSSRGRRVTGWRGTSAPGGACPCGVGVCPRPGRCGQQPSLSPRQFSNLVIYVGLCRHGLPHPSSLFLFIETWLLSCPCVSIHIHLLNKRWDSGVPRSLCPGCLSVREQLCWALCVGQAIPPLQVPSLWQQVKGGGRGPAPRPALPEAPEVVLTNRNQVCARM